MEKIGEGGTSVVLAAQDTKSDRLIALKVLREESKSHRVEDNIRFRKETATMLPNAGDFRSKQTDDQAAQIYVLFPKFPKFVNTRIVGYHWDSEAPKGARGASPAWPKIKCIVLRDKTDPLGVWVEEKRNIYEDYIALFDEEPGR